MDFWTHVLLSAAIAVLGISYHCVVRPWHLRWGAAGDEATRILPGDNVALRANAPATHAISINAPANQVWPWLIQIGQQRGGFYSYAWLENLFGCQMSNANEIVPEWQHREIGDQVWLHPKAPPLTVLAMESDKLLVLGGRSLQRPDDGDAPTVALGWIWVWAFVLDEHSDNHTRLIVRIRGRWNTSWWVSATNYVFGEPAHFIMERKMLLGIKQRVESGRR